MKPRHLASVAVVTTLLAAGSASAQTPNLPPSGPATAPAPVPAGAPPRAGMGVVRVHVHTLKNKGTAHLYSRRTDGTFGLLCNSPCTADVPVNNELRITLGNDEDEPHSFTVTGDLGSEIDLEVKPASIGPVIGGIIMMGSGGAFVLSGLLFLALSDITESSKSSIYRDNNNTAEAYQTIGYVFIGLGVGIAAGGLVWLLTRSHEPRVTDTPHDPQRPQVYGRNETLLGDVAALRPRVSAPSFTPLQYGFSF